MKKKCVVFSALALALIMAAQFGLGAVPVSATETVVVAQNGSGDYTSIQAAVDAAKPGDTVVVRKGIYYEEVTVSKGGTKEKPITLRAESNGLGDVVITAADKTIREHQKQWTVVEGTDNEVWWVDYDRDVGSVTCNDLFMLYPKTLDQLITQSVGGTSYIGFPELGFFWDSGSNRLYIRLSPEYVSENGAEEGKPLVSTNPNDPGNTVCVGGLYYNNVENPNAGSGTGGQGQAVRKNTDSYNIAVWIDGDAWVNIEGFTLETPGCCGIYVRGDNTVVRDCWFRGCRIGVKGGSAYLHELDLASDPSGNTLFATSDVVIEHCDFSQYPFYTDTGRMITDRAPSDAAKNPHWAAKNEAVRFDYETVGFLSGAGYNWEICYNRTFETFDTLSQRWKAIGYKIEGDRSDIWIDGGGHKVHHNRFERAVDNVIEFENHASDIEFYNNECIDVLQAVSWQPLDYYPLPQNLYIYNNLFYNTPEHEAVFGIGSPFKLGQKKDVYNTTNNQSLGFWLETSTTANRHWFVDDRGMWIYNNTIVVPGTVPLATLGAWRQDGIDGSTGLAFVNNIFYSKINDGKSGLSEKINEGSLFQEPVTLIYATNMVIAGNPEQKFAEDSRYIQEGYAYKDFAAAGLTLVTDPDGIQRIEISNGSSTAVSGGTQLPFTAKDTTYLGALPYGEKWEQNFGVQVRGDVNFDGVADSRDILEIAARMDAARGDDHFVGHGDLNYDGKLDNGDIAILNDILAGGAAQ